MVPPSAPIPSPAPGWRERWIGWRNARLADPAFQRLALRLPLVRGIARRRAAGLFDVVAGFVYAQTLAACAQLRLLDRLAARPADATALAAGTPLSPAAMQTLLRAAAALDLAEALPDGRFMLGAQGAAARANPGIAAMVAHHRLLYADLADPVSLLAAGPGQGSLAGFWPYADSDSGAAGEYSALMTASQAMVADQVLAAHDFGRHAALLDIGGGHGAFVAAVAARHPRLGLGLFDLPAVADGARARLAGLGLGRVAVTGGSFRDDPLPPGFDAISLIRILHDHDDTTVAALLASIAASLPRGGRLIIAEPLAQTPGARPMGDGYFGFYLWAMGQGRPRTATTYCAMLAAAGFASVREVPTALPLVTRLLVAIR